MERLGDWLCIECYLLAGIFFVTNDTNRLEITAACGLIDVIRDNVWPGTC